MNLSGNAVRYWMQKENIPLENVLIIVDDLALSFGTLRLKGKGSDAGHNGLKHIAAILGTQNYARLAISVSVTNFHEAARWTMCWDILPKKIRKRWMNAWKQQERSSRVSAWQELILQ